MELISLINYSVAKVKIPDDLFVVLKDEASKLETEGDLFKSGITGPYADYDMFTTHWNMREDTLKVWQPFIMEISKEYMEAHPEFLTKVNYYVGIENQLKFKIDRPWWSRQEKGHFLPNHMHDGVLSYATWVDIPNFPQDDYSGKFEIVYNTIDGNTKNQRFTPEEGYMIMFPASQMHVVYPFFGEGVRKSFSGNILID